MKAWTAAGAAACNLALYQAGTSSHARRVAGMAERGHLPEIFAERGRHGAPTYALAISASISLGVGFFPFMEILEMMNLMACVVILVEYAAFVRLRVSRPDLHRPYRIPIGTLGCAAMLLPAAFFVLLLMALATWQSYAAFGVTVAVGGLLNHLQSAGGRRGWWRIRGDDLAYAGVPEPPPESPRE
uniref:Amino acid permease/ SLC12A domain-containing protein n=1 Tax=Corethron hystrix TaxID=216773 RepID=A0A7S1BU33_9STRA